VNLLINCKGIELLPISFFHLSVQAEAPIAAMDEGAAVIEGAAARISHVLCKGSRQARGSDAEIAHMDMLDWLSAKISDRVSVSPSRRKKIK
jgi:hypothetical protein